MFTSREKSFLWQIALLILCLPMAVFAAEPEECLLPDIPEDHDFTELDPNHIHHTHRLLVRFGPCEGDRWPDTGEKLAILQPLGITAIEHEYHLVCGLCAVALPENLTVTEALTLLNNTPGILYAEPDYVVRDMATFPNDPHISNDPEDPCNLLWGLHNAGQMGGTPDADIDAPEAWDFIHDGDIILAVIDSGVDYTHPDLADNLWVNQAELNGDPNIDDDGNGYVDDIRG